MDKRWKNLAIIAVVLCIIGMLAYFLPIHKAEPTKNLEDLRAIWAAYGIDADYLNDAYSELLNLSDSELMEMRNQFKAFQKQSAAPWLRDLADIYSTSIAIELKRRKIFSIKEKIAGLKDSCSNLALFTNLLSEQENLVSLVNQYGNKLKAFSENYPQNFEKLNLRANVNSAELNRVLNTQRALVASLQEVCR